MVEFIDRLIQLSKQRLTLSAWALLFCVLVGCDSGPQTHRVSGQVTFQGKPVDQGLINFRGEDGSLYGGALEQDGEYECRLPAGEFDVRIDAPAPMPPGWKEGDPLPRRPQRLAPLKYANFRSAGLRATVSSDPDTHRIDYELP